jgi:hypothetical protein
MQMVQPIKENGSRIGGMGMAYCKDTAGQLSTASGDRCVHEGP